MPSLERVEFWPAYSGGGVTRWTRSRRFTAPDVDFLRSPRSWYLSLVKKTNDILWETLKIAP